jgi:hypothetical protein
MLDEVYSYSNLETAPEPNRDGARITVNAGDGYLRQYVAYGKRWWLERRYQPYVEVKKRRRCRRK